MGVRARIDTAPNFRHPQFDPIVNENRERQTELVAVESTLRLADDDCIKIPHWRSERFKQSSGLGAPLPRQRTGLTDVEELTDNLTVDGLDDLAGTGELPVPRRLWILLIFGRYPAVEHEPHIKTLRLEADTREPHCLGQGSSLPLN